MSQRVANGAMPDGRSSATGSAGKLRPDGGLLARIALSAIVVGAGLAIVFAVLFLAVVSLRHRSVEARNSQQVIATANRVQTLVIDLETGVRGFVITHDERYLNPWRAAQKQYPATIATLLAPDNRQCASAPARSLDQGRCRHLLDDVLTSLW